MILYFSGTGNSKYIAKGVAKIVEDELVDVFDYVKEGKTGEFFSKKPYVLVAPTYSWRIPLFLSSFLRASKFEGNKNFYTIINCGSSSGAAMKYIKKDLDFLGLHDCGLYEILMPENYLALFTLDSEEKNQETVEKAKGKIIEAGEIILKGEKFLEKKPSGIDWFLSGIVNPIFYRWIVHDKKFYFTEDCIQCGLCAKVCVFNNIKYKEGYPTWNGHCTHCMACIARCPRKAIEYGKKSLGQERYLLK